MVKKKQLLLFYQIKTGAQPDTKLAQLHMATFKISSPAYRANGLNGMYYSIAICKNDGTIEQIVGDHAMLANTYTNVSELEGKSFTDSDRFISVKKIECDVDGLNNYVAAREAQAIEEKEWDVKHNAFTGGNAYDFCYSKKSPKGNLAKYNEWKQANPYPKATVSYYSFLEAIKIVDEETLVTFFERLVERHPFPFMAAKIYGRDEAEEKNIQAILDEMGIKNPYPNDTEFNELRNQYFKWNCVRSTNWLIAEGKEIDPKCNPTEWKKF